MDYYAILEIKYGATKDEIKKAFHRLAHIHHPDKGGNVEKFKKINNAYQELMKGNNPQPQSQRGNPGNYGFKQYQYNNNSQFHYGSTGTSGNFYYQYQERQQRQQEDINKYMQMMRDMMGQYSQKPYNQEQAKPQKKWKYDPKRGMVYE